MRVYSEKLGKEDGGSRGRKVISLMTGLYRYGNVICKHARNGKLVLHTQGRGGPAKAYQTFWKVNLIN